MIEVPSLVDLLFAPIWRDCSTFLCFFKSYLHISKTDFHLIDWIFSQTDISNKDLRLSIKKFTVYYLLCIDCQEDGMLIPKQRQFWLNMVLYHMTINDMDLSALIITFHGSSLALIMIYRHKSGQFLLLSPLVSLIMITVVSIKLHVVYHYKSISSWADFEISFSPQ